MLTLSVSRQDGVPLDSKSPATSLFYDESVTVRLESPNVCSMHLYVTVLGSLKDRESDHSIVIFDEDLPRDKEWAPIIHIRHPRSPLQNPHLEIVATARYAEICPGKEGGGEEDVETHLATGFVSPFVPVPSAKSNFLVPFSTQASTNETSEDTAHILNHRRDVSSASGIDFAEAYEERRSSSHLELIASATPRVGLLGEPYEHKANGQQEGSIEVLRWKAPLVQALELEIRSLRPALERDRVIAEVHLVSGNHDVRVNMCDVELEDGLADLMGMDEAPFSLGAREKYAKCYNLQLRAAGQLTATPASRKPLTISLECEVLLNNAPSSSSNPKITTTWTPVVDFEGTQGPLPKTPALHLGVNSPSVPQFSSSSSVLGTGGSSSTLDLVGRQNSSTNLSLLGGVSIMITGPQFVKVGETFEWTFKIVNRSQRNRLFTITFGNLMREVPRKDLLLTGDPLASISTYNAEILRRRAVSHYRAIGANRGILPLCQELRVGNLAPHVCFETKIKLCALSQGTHTIETARIEDLTNRDSYDVGSLLEVIVLSNDENGPS